MPRERTRDFSTREPPRQRKGYVSQSAERTPSPIFLHPVHVPVFRGPAEYLGEEKQNTDQVATGCGSPAFILLENNLISVHPFLEEGEAFDFSRGQQRVLIETRGNNRIP